MQRYSIRTAAASLTLGVSDSWNLSATSVDHIPYCHFRTDADGEMCGLDEVECGEVRLELTLALSAVSSNVLRPSSSATISLR